MYFKNEVVEKESQETTVRIDNDGVHVYSSDSQFINELHAKGYDMDVMNAWHYFKGKKDGVSFKLKKDFIYYNAEKGKALIGIHSAKYYEKATGEKVTA